MVDFFSEKNIVGPHGVPDPPFLAQMTFTKCTRIGRNFVNLLVFVSSFMDNYRANVDLGPQDCG